MNVKKLPIKKKLETEKNLMKAIAWSRLGGDFCSQDREFLNFLSIIWNWENPGWSNVHLKMCWLSCSQTSLKLYLCFFFCDLSFPNDEKTCFNFQPDSILSRMHFYISKIMPVCILMYFSWIKKHTTLFVLTIWSFLQIFTSFYKRF